MGEGVEIGLSWVGDQALIVLSFGEKAKLVLTPEAAQGIARALLEAARQAEQAGGLVIDAAIPCPSEAGPKGKTEGVLQGWEGDHVHARKNQEVRKSCEGLRRSERD